MTIDNRHGGPYDRGGADSYYRRRPVPHCYAADDVWLSKMILEEDMSKEEIKEYWQGYNDNEKAGFWKDWD